MVLMNKDNSLEIEERLCKNPDVLGVEIKTRDKKVILLLVYMDVKDRTSHEIRR